MNRTLSSLSLALIAASASAQTLPPPAPLLNPTPSPSPTPATILENPPTSEEPIVIGEPVRTQKTPKPAATVKPTPRPLKKVVVAGVDVTGLSDAKALAKLQSALAPTLSAPVRLTIGGYQYTFLRAELGAQIPYALLLSEAKRAGATQLRFQINRATLEKALRELDGLVREDFQDTALNLGGTRARVLVALEKAPVADRIVTLYSRVKTAPPSEIAAQEHETTPQKPTGNGKFPYLWASFSTRYDASLRGRTTNLKMAANHIDGTVVAPGKTFSTNLAIGPRNASAGWKEAKMFVSGRVVSGTGSGICQAASTLYNAALLADFPIVERHAHSMRVTYVPPSRDAALMWGSKDFKFKNNSDTSLRVNTKVSGGKFHAWIWGQKPRTGPEIKVVSNVISRRGGTKSEAFQIVGGQKKRLSRDFYKPHP